MLFIHEQLSPADGHMVFLILMNLVPFIGSIKKKLETLTMGSCYTCIDYECWRKEGGVRTV